MTRFVTAILLIILTLFARVSEARVVRSTGAGKIAQPRVRPVMAGGVKQQPAPRNAKKKVMSKPKVIRIPFSPFEYDTADLHTDLAFDMFWRSTPLL